MMRRAKGVTLAKIMESTGWRKHTVRGFMSLPASLKVDSVKNAAGERTYRITSSPPRGRVTSKRRFRLRPGPRSLFVATGHFVQSGSMGVEAEEMETKQKMAIAGSGLILGGIGLGIVGAALVVPAVFEWTARLAGKGVDGLLSKVEGASKTVGTVAGTLHRSFNEAKRAGVAELRRSRSDERSVAG
jgi:hypothetical protein